jgi:hypothetical protein
MTHAEGSDSYSDADSWFVFHFEKQQAGLSGLAFDEGCFSGASMQLCRLVHGPCTLYLLQPGIACVSGVRSVWLRN